MKTNLEGEVAVVQHGISHPGPVGPTLSSASFLVCQDSERCLPCPCIRPLPLMLPHLAELQPGTDYLLTLHLHQVLDSEHGGSEGPGGKMMGSQESRTQKVDEGGSVWGYKGPPTRRQGEVEAMQKNFRWFQVQRPDLASSVGSAQFPIIYYIS